MLWFSVICITAESVHDWFLNYFSQDALNVPWLSFSLNSLLGFPGNAGVADCLWTLAAVIKETLKDALVPRAGTGLLTRGSRQEEQLSRNSSGIVRLRDTSSLPCTGRDEVLLKCSGLSIFIF